MDAYRSFQLWVKSLHLTPFVFCVFLFVLYAYCGIRNWQWVQTLIRKGGPALEFVTQPYFVFYLFLAGLCCTVDWIYSPASFFGLLDPRISTLQSVAAQERIHGSDRPMNLCLAVVEAVCRERYCVNGSCFASELEQCQKSFPDPCTLLVLPQWLRWMVILAPPSVILAVIITVVHTYKHMQYGRPWSSKMLHELHDYSIQIITLAPVYGIFSLQSVVNMIQLIEGRVDNSVFLADEGCAEQMRKHGVNTVSVECWSAYRGHLVGWYELNFIVADIWEARALYCFTHLCLRYMNVQMRKRGLFSSSCGACNKRCPTCGGENSVVSKLTLQPLREMTMLGVRCFVWTNFLRAFFRLALEAVRLYSADAAALVDSYKELEKTLDSAAIGFVFCVSGIAIWNLVTFEFHFSDVMEGFRPKTKFWSAKIIVSLAFIQNLLVSQLGRILPNQGHAVCAYQENLAYASLMCLEMFPVAILQWVAWSPASIQDVAALDEVAELTGNEAGLLRLSIEHSGQKLEVAVDQQWDGEQTFWRSASVTLLKGVQQ